MHSDLINALGGNSAVAKALGIQTNRVWNWNERGRIAWPYRSKIAQLAAGKGIPVPEGFLDPDAQDAEAPADQESAA